jgi:hypothetical protein
MKFDWQQFVISGERFKLTEQASLVAKPRSMFFAGENFESIQTAKKPLKKKVVITGDISPKYPAFENFNALVVFIW